jgi:hypothetical protein
MAIDQDKRDNPYPFIMEAIKILKSRGMNKVIEIGCVRGPLNHFVHEYHHMCCNDGHSTALFACSGLQVTSIDIDPAAVRYAQEMLSKYSSLSSLAKCIDGIGYLKSITEPIQLLYLDAWDVGIPNSAENHLEAYKIANKNMVSGSLLLIDDTDVDYENNELIMAKVIPGGKGRLLYPQAISDGYEEIFRGRQTLLSKL